MPRLVIRTGPFAGRDHALGGECVVGRHPTVTFPVEDNLLSRRHFRIVPAGGTWLLEDLGSTNGTRVNGQRVMRHPLVDGDVIRAGSTEVVFVQKDLLGKARGGADRAAPRRGDAPVSRRRRRR